jgi:hypothetical protein
MQTLLCRRSEQAGERAADQRITADGIVVDEEIQLIQLERIKKDDCACILDPNQATND